MINKLAQALFDIKAKVAEMSLSANRMFASSIEALKNHDLELAKAVVGLDDTVDRLDVEIDDMCLKALALYSPKAAELRYIVAVLHMIIDLERVGDNSKVIAKQIKNHHCAPLLARLEKFDELAGIVRGMLEEAMGAFFSKDIKKYEDIVEADKIVGKLQKQVNKRLIKIIAEDSADTDAVISLINVVRRMERIADHAKNIAELVPYVATGLIVRHKRLKNEANPAD